MVDKRNAAPTLETQERQDEKISYDSYVRRFAELLLLSYREQSLRCFS